MGKRTFWGMTVLGLCLCLILSTAVACSGNASGRNLGGLTVTVRELDASSRSVSGASVSTDSGNPYTIEIWTIEESPSKIITVPDVKKSSKFSIGGLPVGSYAILVYEETADGLRPCSSSSARIERGGDTKVSVGVF
ncbi:MAG: hypothetical protein SPD11_14320 [Sphaerochaetaceae bacterium]|nr:hypothetical protein [Sphaerochaetaceae bacterium]